MISAPPPDLSMRAPLRRPAFRRLWLACSVYYVGNFMQAMAAAWTVLALTGSSFLAALVQTALFLPRFLLSLPAGVLADLTDRDRLVRVSLTVQTVCSLLLCVLLAWGAANAWAILLLVFVIGCCAAMMAPGWYASVADLVPREEMPQAITALSIGFNAARAIGPTLAGAVYATFGGAWNYALAVLSTASMLHASRKAPARPRPPSRLPPERLWGGMLSALRFVRHSGLVRAQMLRTVAFSTTGSALWALLPAIGQQRLGMGAAGYGLLMGSLGTGAVCSGLLVGRLRQTLGLERVVAAASGVFGAAMLVAAFSRSPAVVLLTLLPGGAAWMAAMSTFDTTTQTSVPPWIRARALAMQTVCTLGAIALGSALWGALADPLGLTPTLVLAAALLLSSLALARRFPLRVGAETEVTPAADRGLPALRHEPAPEDGPVAVEISYRVEERQAEAFLDALVRLRAPRQRDGAISWCVYRDLDEGAHYVERFVVDSWAGYLHQRMRSTQADEALESRVRGFLRAGEPARTKHYLAATPRAALHDPTPP